MLQAFEGSSPLEVNHKDGDKHNNQLSNLEYVTSSENKQHALKTGLTVYNKPTAGLKLNVIRLVIMVYCLTEHVISGLHM